MSDIEEPMSDEAYDPTAEIVISDDDASDDGGNDDAMKGVEAEDTRSDAESSDQNGSEAEPDADERSTQSKPPESQDGSEEVAEDDDEHVPSHGAADETNAEDEEPSQSGSIEAEKAQEDVVMAASKDTPEAASGTQSQPTTQSQQSQSQSHEDGDRPATEQSQSDDKDNTNNDDDDEEYEPLLPGLTFDVPSQLATTEDESDRPTRTRAGFLVDDSDDDGESAARIHSSMQSGAQSIVHSRAQSQVQSLQSQAQPQAQSQLQSQSQSQPQSQSQQKQAAPEFFPETKTRLPKDIAGILEDRIKEDSQGDVDAWIGLIAEHESKDKLEEARDVYERCLAQFPTAANQWVSYVKLELAHDQFFRAEQLFGRSLLNVLDFQLWWTYLDYIRRQNNIVTDTTGDARNVVLRAYDFALQNVGLDPNAGELWRDYISFLKTGPGAIGGTGWQDQQKTDLIRRAYRRAIAVPTDAVCAIWKDYDAFELGLSRLRGRKFLQEVSASYMTARTAQMALADLIAPLDRRTPPRLPPVVGFHGHAEYHAQVGLWKKRIDWELEDPLFLRDEDPTAYRARVLYAFRQALISLRFWPSLWLEAAQFCYLHKLNTQGDKFIDDGIAANPENSLLAFHKADRIEVTTAAGEDLESRRIRGDAVRAPYDSLLDVLYGLINKHKTKEQIEINRARENFGEAGRGEASSSDAAQDAPENPALAALIEPIQSFHRGQITLLTKTISFTWIALMRAMRRVQGHGVDRKQLGGFRRVFLDARKRGRLTSDVYIASALIEHHCFHDPAGTVVFERGMKLFPDDGKIVLAYLKHLISKHEIANARAEFEKSVARFVEKAETVEHVRPLFRYMHEYESHFGELSHVVDIERRMCETFPGESKADLFARRYSEPEFDPTTVQFIISPVAQTRPPDMIGHGLAPIGPEGIVGTDPYSTNVQVQPIGPVPTGPSFGQQPGRGGPVGPSGPVGSMMNPNPGQASNVGPKRMASEIDEPGFGESSMTMPPRKMARNDRGESPLKGAAGRRLATLRNAAAAAGIAGGPGPGPGPGADIRGPGAPSSALGTVNTGPSGQGTMATATTTTTTSVLADPLPSNITFLLGILPSAETYLNHMNGPAGWTPEFDPIRLTALISRLDLGLFEARLTGRPVG